jgi:hypothetical protein
LFFYAALAGCVTALLAVLLVPTAEVALAPGFGWAEAAVFCSYILGIGF